MTEKEIMKAYKKGFEQGQTHSAPSLETRQFIITMTKEIEYIKERLEKMPTKDEMLLANEKLVEKIFEKADKRYASKLVEKITYGLIGIVVIAVFYALLKKIGLN